MRKANRPSLVKIMVVAGVTLAVLWLLALGWTMPGIINP